MPAVPRYALLPAPAANRVYAEAAAAMVRAELTVLSRAALAGRIGTVETETLAGVEYLAFEADELTDLVDLMRHLRYTEARRHVRDELPFYTGRRVGTAELAEILVGQA